MMMTMQSLIDAVCAAPDDMAPRVRFAEYCTATGDHDRAEFIRAQLADVESARAGGVAPDPLREMDLRHRHGRAWAGLIADRVRSYAFYGGFVERIEIDAAKLLAEAAELVRLAPIRRLRLSGVGPVVDELFASPLMARIVSLELADDQHLGDAAIRRLAASPHLGKLAYLSIGRNDVTLDGIEALAASTGLPALLQLESGRNPGDVNEIVGDDLGHICYVAGAPQARAIEAKHGRKTWLHTVEDRGRPLSPIEL
jgi:uncharacterized protein (TIGR02996 family)